LKPFYEIETCFALLPNDFLQILTNCDAANVIISI